VLGETRVSRATGPRANPDKQIDNGALLAGSPSSTRDKLLTIVEKNGPGHNYMARAFQWGNMTHAEAMQSLHLFATGIIPALAERRTPIEAAAG
jgi:hypothetical protein